MSAYTKLYPLSGAVWIFLLLQGCMTSSSSMPANKALALSASALSGSEEYKFAGKLSVFDPIGFVGHKAEYNGEVTLHGNLKIQWKPSNTGTGLYSSNTKKQQQPVIAYEPLQLLQAIKDQSAVITYAEQPVPSQPVHLQIKLDDTVAKERVAEDLRAEFALLRADTGLVQSNPVKAEDLLNAANKRLEAALSTLSVRTACEWTANPKDWFPSQLKEETILTYSWDGKTYQEKRIAETNFLSGAQGGTMMKWIK